MAERRAHVAAHQDALRRAVVCEPRGHEAVVGALLTAPTAPGSAAGVVFFDNAGVLNMCGHGTIGVVRTLAFLGRLPAGEVRLDTSVGTVGATLEPDGGVVLENVPAFCHERGVVLDVPGLGRVEGDVAWGGNWFFLTELPRLALELANAPALTAATTLVLEALRAAGVTGRDGAPVDHVELFGAPRRADADARNFVLCPSLTYDRSPCGRQESITGSLFEAWLEERAGALVPRVRGRAYVTGRATLLFDPEDPFREGIAARP
jgi:proline racemase